MIITKSFTDSKRNYIKIIDDIFKSKRVANEFNLSEKNIRALNHSWHTGVRLSILLDPINMNLLITDKDLRELSKVNNEYTFLGKTILLGNINLNNYRKNKLFEKHISPTGTSDLTLNKIKEFLESNNFKRKVLKMTDALLKEKLICTENEYISDLYNLEVLFSEATTSQKLYTYYIESKHRGKKNRINMNSLKIDNDLGLLLNAKEEIVNYLISKDSYAITYNPFTFLSWFNEIFTNTETDTMVDIFKLTKKLFEKKVNNPDIKRAWILSNLNFELNKIAEQKPQLFQINNLSIKDKKEILAIITVADIQYILSNNEHFLNLFKQDFIFNYKLYDEIFEESTSDYLAFHIDELVNIDTSNLIKDRFKLTIIPKNITDIYLEKEKFERFRTIITALNLEMTDYIPLTTTIHFIEDNLRVLDRFINLTDPA